MIEKVIVQHTDDDRPEADIKELMVADYVLLVHPDETVTAWKARDSTRQRRVPKSELPSKLQQLLAERDVDGGWQAIARFPSATGEASPLAEEIHENGLLFLLNSAVLHTYGYALGVDTAKDGGGVTGLVLYKTDDPDGLWFDEETVQEARKKLRAHWR